MKVTRYAVDAEKELWYFSVVDVVGVLSTSDNPRNYWKVLKNRLKQDGSEMVTKCNQLKMQASYEGGNPFVSDVDPMIVGVAAMNLGGGRKKKEDKIDHHVGIVVKAKVGMPLQKNDLIGYVYSDNTDKTEEEKLELQRAVTTSAKPVNKLPVTLETYPEVI